MKREAAWLLMIAVLVSILLGQSVLAARNYYKIMGVDKEADERTIKRAYKVRNITAPLLIETLEIEA
jgi:DnaJ-related protein SCJ1